MKHHKAKGVWRHRPDEVPIPDGPSTGSRVKKGPLSKAGNKQLWDLAKQGVKNLGLKFKWIVYSPVSFVFSQEFNLKSLEADCSKLEDVLLELERRMK